MSATMPAATPDAGARRPRFALVGCGDFGKQLARYAVEHAELAALCDPDAGNLAATAAALGTGVPGYHDYRELLRRERLDAVLVTAANHVHAEITVAAAEAGVHVFCEKAMARTARECWDMVAACRRHGVKLMVGHKRRLRPPWARMVELTGRRPARPAAVDHGGAVHGQPALRILRHVVGGPGAQRRRLPHARRARDRLVPRHVRRCQGRARRLRAAARSPLRIPRHRARDVPVPLRRRGHDRRRPVVSAAPVPRVAGAVGRVPARRLQAGAVRSITSTCTGSASTRRPRSTNGSTTWASTMPTGARSATSSAGSAPAPSRASPGWRGCAAWR